MGKEIERIIKKSKMHIKLIRKMVNVFLESLLELIYPSENYCIICKAEDCHKICLSCLKIIKKINIIDSDISSYGYYGGVLKQLILNLKYKKNFSAGDILSDFLSDYIKDNIEYDNYMLSYIPLSKKSKKKRGFNQCEYIAKKVSEKLNIEAVEILIKYKDTAEQKTLNKHERSENIKGAFKVKKGINVIDCNIILIDDVTTTGSTMIEAYKILQENSAKSIKLLTLAKSAI